MEKEIYKDFIIEYRVIKWNTKNNWFRFELLNDGFESETFAEGLIKAKERIDTFIDTKIITIQEASDEIYKCFYTDEGGGLYSHEELLHEVIKKINSNLI